MKKPQRKLLQMRLDIPHVPGEALHGDIDGCYKIKSKKQGMRLVYGVEDDVFVVIVIAVDKREDGAVYQSVMARTSGKLASIAQATKSQRS